MPVGISITDFWRHLRIVQINLAIHSVCAKILRHRVFVADVSVSLDAFRRHTLHPQNNIALKTL